jgi:hypothetical protein
LRKRDREAAISRSSGTLLIGLAHPTFRGELKQWAAQVRHFLL